MKRNPFYLCALLAAFLVLCGDVHAFSPNLQLQSSSPQEVVFGKPSKLKDSLSERPDLRSTDEIKKQILNEKKASVCQEKDEPGVTFSPKGHPDITIVGSPRSSLIDFDLSASQPLFSREPILISGNSPENLSKINFKWFTLSGGDNIVFENLDISGKIQITARANVIFRNCKFSHDPNQPSTTKGMVHAFAYSSVFFENCEMCSSISENKTKSDVLVVGHSYAYFDKCKFSSSCIGVLSEKWASVQAFDCSFNGCSGESLNFGEKSKAFIQGCSFDDQEGTFISSNNSELDILQCNFKNDNLRFNSNKTPHYAILLNKESKSKISGCSFSDLPGCAVMCIKNSDLNIKGCRMNHIGSNAISFSHSKGNVSSCEFEDFQKYSPILVCGIGSDPVIEDCQIKNTVKPGINIRSAASPIIKNIHISKMKGNQLISCCDLSSPVIENISFDSDDVVPSIVVMGASRPKIKLSSDINIEKIESPSIFEGLKIRPEDTKNKLKKLKIITLEYGNPIICKEGDSLEPERLDLDNIDVPAYNIIEGDNRRISNRCGHRINPDDFENGDKLCHICGVEAGKLVKVFPSDSNECVICMDAEPLAIMLPCGHRCCCFKCANECKQKNDSKCPVCRSIIQGVRYDFADSSHLTKK